MQVAVRFGPLQTSERTYDNRYEVGDGGYLDLEILGYRLRRATPHDAEAFVAYLKRNWPRFAPAIPTPTDASFLSETYRSRFAEDMDQRRSPWTISMVIIRDDNEVMGDITFSNIIYGAFQACYLAFKIDHQLEGRGIMRRALENCCKMMFVEFKLHRIMANYRPENVRSAALLKRLGFRPEGFARDYLHLDGAWRDHVLTALVK